VRRVENSQATLDYKHRSDVSQVLLWRLERGVRGEVLTQEGRPGCVPLFFSYRAPIALIALVENALAADVLLLTCCPRLGAL